MYSHIAIKPKRKSRLGGYINALAKNSNFDNYANLALKIKGLWKG
jgi:hypothetical protein